MILKKLKRYLISEKEKLIFDIVLYGSIMKGKTAARDIDILVIFLEGDLRQRLDTIQGIKNRLKKKTDGNIDIKQILLKELFSPEFLARTGILLEGFSIFKNKKFCETFGFSSYPLFWYSLKELNHTQKVKFNYILAGRNQKGMIKHLGGKRVAGGVIKIPIENSLELEEILKKNNINYNKKNMLEEI